MMKNFIVVAVAVIALTGCAQKRFDRVENTPVSRYDIVYDDTKCGVDRYHLLSDLVDCITEKLQLCIAILSTETVDRIAVCTIDFSVHSAGELSAAIKSISAIEGVDEVHRVEID